MKKAERAKMDLYAYIKSHKTKRAIAGFAVFAGAGLLGSYGLFLIINVIALLVSGASIWGVLPFGYTIADLFLSFLYFLGAIVLFLAGYLLMRSHYGGVIVAGIFGLCFFFASLLGSINSVLGLTIAVFCIAGASLGLWEERKSIIAKPLASVVEENVAKNALRLAALIAVGSLFAVVTITAIRGSSYFSWGFLTNGWPPGGWGTVVNIIEGQTSGVFGCGPALAGSLLVCGVCELICIPLGLGSAIFLAEYAPQNFFTRIVHFFVELLAGIPSIILGIFGFTFFAVEFGWNPKSLLGGAICLAFMTLPWNVRVAEESIKAVSEDFKAASYALGATKLQTIRRVILESAAPGILTGILLGFGAAFGEAAVAIFTVGNPYANWPSTTNLWKFLTGYDIPTLPAWIYGAFRGPGVSHGVKEQNVAFAGALVLIAIFITITITALVVRNHFNKKLSGA
jgi:phosphate transport system permease protein